MKILYLAHRMPFPPNKGDKMRACRELTYLARRHDIWCACFADAEGDLKHADTLRRLVRGLAVVPLDRRFATVRGLCGWLGGSTVTEWFYRSAEMMRTVRAMSRVVGFDAVAAFSSAMAPYALAVPAGRRVLDLCDLDSAKWREYARCTPRPQRWLYTTEGRRLAKREHRWIDAFDASILISRAERDALDGGVDAGKVHVVTNGVGLTSFARTPQGPSGARAPARPVVGFIGVMDYLPNVDAVCWFVRACWPAVRRAVPGATFRIVGRSPVARVRRLAAVPGVVVTGEVGDVRPELERFDLSVAPLRIARGLQNKVLEAMAAGVPVVATSKAAEGLTAMPGRDIVVADDPASMARAVIALSCDNDRHACLAEAGCRYVSTCHRWAPALEAYELIVTAATAPRTSDAAAPGTTFAPEAEPRRSHART